MQFDAIPVLEKCFFFLILSILFLLFSLICTKSMGLTYYHSRVRKNSILTFMCEY